MIAYDARNHGDSEHVDEMSYPTMAEDMRTFLDEDKPSIVMGHSMGGRTAMYLALKWPHLVEKLVIVDVSPVNRRFDTMTGSEWNMSHFFHVTRSVEFPQDCSLFQARQIADGQMAKRIHDPGKRAWLLMNVHQDENGKIGWKINLEGIYNAFMKNIAVFPDRDFADDVWFMKETLFIGGAFSDFIPINDHDEIFERFPNADIEYITGAGHWVHSDQPNDFLECLFRFLK